MLMPSARVSVAKTTLISPRAKSCSTTSFSSGSIPAWWAAKPSIAARRNRCRRSTSSSSMPMPDRCSSSTARISRRSASSVRRSRARAHWSTAPSQPAREKMNMIAGSRAASSSSSTISGRRGVRCPPPRRGSAPRPREPCPPPGPRPCEDRCWPEPRGRCRPLVPLRPRGLRPRGPPVRSSTGREKEVTRSIWGFTWRSGRAPGPWETTASPSASTNRSSSSSPTITCCHSGTGRVSETMMSVLPRTSCSQAPNSSALETVADSETSCTERSRWMMTSSHTGPRSRSAR